MDKGFIEIIQKLVAEQGKEALFDHRRCKAFLDDYTKNKYKNESRLLLYVLESGVQKEIIDTEYIDICKENQIKMLHEEHYLSIEIATNVVDMLALVLRGDESKTETKINSNTQIDFAQKQSQTSGNGQSVSQKGEQNVIEQLMKKANKFLENEDYESAIRGFDEIIKLYPNYAPAHNGRGEAYCEEGEYDLAIKSFTEAIWQDDNFVDAYFNRGWAYYDKKDYNRAIKDYTQTIKLDPNFITAYNNRGYAYYEKGDYDRAIEDFNQAIKLDPDDAVYYGNRGHAYYRKKDYNRAIKDYEISLQINPNDTTVRQDIEDARKARGR